MFGFTLSCADCTLTFFFLSSSTHTWTHTSFVLLSKMQLAISVLPCILSSPPIRRLSRHWVLFQEQFLSRLSVCVLFIFFFLSAFFCMWLHCKFSSSSSSDGKRKNCCRHHKCLVRLAGAPNPLKSPTLSPSRTPMLVPEISIVKVCFASCVFPRFYLLFKWVFPFNFKYNEKSVFSEAGGDK